MIRISAATFGLIAALLLAGLQHAGGSELLANGGFEQGSSGWSVTAGQLDAVQSPVHAGALAGRFSGSGQPTTQFAYQWINVQPGQGYELSGWAAMSGGGLSRLFLQVDWFDASSQQVPSRQPSNWLPLGDGTFYFLTTGRSESPAAARQARVSVFVQADSAFEVHLDDLAFTGPAALPPPPTTPLPPTTPPPAVTPAPQPPAATPTRTPRRTPTPAPQATGGAPTSPAAEPVVFDRLVNGGFEQIRFDGTPYGWRKQGGEMATVNDPKTEGSSAAALTSQTTSTKWLYQTATVRGGAHYEASVDAQAGPGSESVFLRLSWYASADGSGQAIDSVDSVEAATPAEVGFARLTTGVAAAPPGAGTAKVRLMLRPASQEAATAYFDSAVLLETSADVQTAGRRASRGAVSAAGRGSAAEPVAVGGAEALPAGATPVRLANLKPPQRDGSSPLAAGSGSGDDWPILLALGIAGAAIAIAGGYEFWQRRRGGDIGADEN